MPDNPPAGTQRVTARLAYTDPRAALAFLEHAFGFAERPEARIERGDGSIIITEVQIGDAYVMIGAAGGHGLESPAVSGKPSAALIVYVDAVDAHFATARAHGAAIVSEPTDQYWGDRRYEARDEEGHLWSFHEHVRDVSPEEIAAVEAEFRKT